MEKEKLAEQLHNWYLEAIRQIQKENYNTNADKPYSELTEEQKFIDRFIADKILTLLELKEEGVEEDVIRGEEEAMGQYEEEARGRYEEMMREYDEELARWQYENSQPPPEEIPF
jgi:hypothetical protein